VNNTFISNLNQFDMKRGKLLWSIAFAFTCLSISGKQAIIETMHSNASASYIPAHKLNQQIPENFTSLSYDTNSMARVARIYVLHGAPKKVNKVTIERKNSLLHWFYILPNNIVIIDYTT